MRFDLFCEFPLLFHGSESSFRIQVTPSNESSAVNTLLTVSFYAALSYDHTTIPFLETSTSSPWKSSRFSWFVDTHASRHIIYITNARTVCTTHYQTDFLINVARKPCQRWTFVVRRAAGQSERMQRYAYTLRSFSSWYDPSSLDKPVILSPSARFSSRCALFSIVVAIRPTAPRDWLQPQELCDSETFQSDSPLYIMY